MGSNPTKFFKSYVFVRAGTSQIDIVQLEFDFLFLFQSGRGGGVDNHAQGVAPPSFESFQCA